MPMRFLAALLCAMFLIAPASAMTVRNDPGGRLDHYAAFWQNVAASRELVRVDGACNSACTMLFHYVPRAQVCVTPRAAFGFHRARTLSFWGEQDSESGTHALTAGYPPVVWNWISRHGGLTSSIKMMRASELHGWFRTCG